MTVTRSGKASGDAKIAPKVSTSVEQLMKAAQKNVEKFECRRCCRTDEEKTLFLQKSVAIDRWN